MRALVACVLAVWPFVRAGRAAQPLGSFKGARDPRPPPRALDPSSAGQAAAPPALRPGAAGSVESRPAAPELDDLPGRPENAAALAPSAGRTPLDISASAPRPTADRP